MHRHSLIVRFSLLCLALVICTTFASAQKKKDGDEEEKKYKEDPYTENDEEVWRKAGYEAMGHFDWAEKHNTADIERLLDGPEIIFIETKHFKIGCSLPDYVISREDQVEKDKLEDELKELRKIIPNIPRRIKVLDKWLRLHLYAMRLEKLYASIQSILQVSDDDFPDGPDQLNKGRYMGQGPYLGMRSKFTLLLFDKESSLGRYRGIMRDNAPAYVEKGDTPIRFLWQTADTLLYACAAQNAGHFSDTTMHCAMVYAVAENLLNGYRHYDQRMPTWLPLGIGHWLARDIDQTRNYFTNLRNYGPEDKNIWKWDTKTRKRVDLDGAISYQKMTTWGEPRNMYYNDHVMAWARVDFLLKEHPDWVAKWLHRMKDSYTIPGGAVFPSAEQIAERDKETVAEIFIFDKGDFESVWQKWVKKNYKRK